MGQIDSLYTCEATHVVSQRGTLFGKWWVSGLWVNLCGSLLVASLVAGTLVGHYLIYLGK